MALQKMVTVIDHLQRQRKVVGIVVLSHLIFILLEDVQSNGDMNVRSIKAGFYFDNTRLQVEKITWEDIVAYSEEEEDDMDNSAASKTAKKKANTDGSALGVYAINNGADSDCYEGVIVTVQFVVIAEGEAKITLREESVGADSFKSDDIDPITITIGSSEPEHVCADENKDHVCDNGCDEPQGEHKSNAPACVAGACEYCGESVAASASHDWQNASYVWSDDNSACTATRVCGNGCSTKEQATAVVTSNTTSGTCKVAATTVYTATFTSDWAVKQTKTVTGEKNSDNHEQTPTYTNNGANHTVAYSCCGASATEDHTYDETTHKCVCGAVETFTLYVNVIATGDTVELTVEYGANLLEVLAKAAENGKIPAIDARFRVKDDAYNGEFVVTGYSYNAGTGENPDWIYDLTGVTMPGYDWWIDQDISSFGWCFDDDGAQYFVEGGYYWLDGWQFVEEDYDDVDGGAWYYFDNEYRVTGLTRVPYPTEAINGVTYAPNAEDLAYEASKGRVFIDATEAWFVFDKDGKFDTTSKIIDGKYSDKGMIVWHPGLVVVEGQLYYFVGDANNGGNKYAEGVVWVTRTNDATGLEQGACYLFENGMVNTDYTDIMDGKYFENGKHMIGAGLVKLGEDYYYVRSSGEFATGKYYITKTNDLKGFTVGMKLIFGQDGKMEAIKNGVVEENGALYFYQNNHMMCGAGLIEYKGAIYYVRSSGKVATGIYYITSTNGMEGFEKNDKLLFGADGKLIVSEKKDGIVEENGALYYYEDDSIQYEAGLVEIEEGVYIYVRSNGQLATGKYYITNVNDIDGFVSGKAYVFGADGKLTVN